jgi:hypothetical protein
MASRTSSNMLLIETSRKAPAELILTPRQDGPTPPNPNAAASEDKAPAEVAAGDAPSPQRPVDERPVQTTALLTPPAALPGSGTQTTAVSTLAAGDALPSGDAGTAPAGSAQAGSANEPQSPGRPKTPQEIYQQLQQLGQQKAQTQPN